jgi:hypothetical protein
MKINFPGEALKYSRIVNEGNNLVTAVRYENNKKR